MTTATVYSEPPPGSNPLLNELYTIISGYFFQPLLVFNGNSMTLLRRYFFFSGTAAAFSGFLQYRDNFRVSPVRCTTLRRTSPLVLYLKICIAVDQQAHYLRKAFCSCPHQRGAAKFIAVIYISAMPQ